MPTNVNCGTAKKQTVTEQQRKALTARIKEDLQDGILDKTTATKGIEAYYVALALKEMTHTTKSVVDIKNDLLTHTSCGQQAKQGPMVVLRKDANGKAPDLNEYIKSLNVAPKANNKTQPAAGGIKKVVTSTPAGPKATFTTGVVDDYLPLVDVDGDGNKDISHGKMVEGVYKAVSPQSNIKTYAALDSDRNGEITDVEELAVIKNMNRDAIAGSLNAVTISIGGSSTYSAAHEMGSLFEDTLKDKISLEKLLARNASAQKLEKDATKLNNLKNQGAEMSTLLKEMEANLKGLTQDEITALKTLTPETLCNPTVRSAYLKVLSPSRKEAFELLNGIIKKGVPVFVAAGNSKDEFNLYSLVEGTTTVSGKASNSANCDSELSCNCTVDELQNHEYTMRFIPNGKEANGKTPFNVDFNNDGKGEITLAKPLLTGTKPYKIAGSSFAAPTAAAHYINGLIAKQKASKN